MPLLQLTDADLRLTVVYTQDRTVGGSHLVWYRDAGAAHPPGNIAGASALPSCANGDGRNSLTSSRDPSLHLVGLQAFVPEAVLITCTPNADVINDDSIFGLAKAGGSLTFWTFRDSVDLLYFAFFLFHYYARNRRRTAALAQEDEPPVAATLNGGDSLYGSSAAGPSSPSVSNSQRLLATTRQVRAATTVSRWSCAFAPHPRCVPPRSDACVHPRCHAVSLITAVTACSKACAAGLRRLPRVDSRAPRVGVPHRAGSWGAQLLPLRLCSGLLPWYASDQQALAARWRCLRRPSHRLHGRVVTENGLLPGVAYLSLTYDSDYCRHRQFGDGAMQWKAGARVVSEQDYTAVVLLEKLHVRAVPC